MAATATSETGVPAQLLKLEYPVALDDGSVVKALLVREPTRSDVDDAFFQFCAHLAGVDVKIIEELDAADLYRLHRLLDTMLPPGR